MAVRVKQPDGSYCYTDNCRIHDRSQASTGRRAVIADQRRIQQEATNRDLSEILRQHLILTEEEAEVISDGLQHLDVESENLAGNVFAYLEPVCMSRAIDPGVFMMLGRKVTDELESSRTLAPGDTVVLNTTGERGLILNGDSRFGEKLIFLPEKNSSPNMHKEFNREDFTKMNEGSGSLARERIFSLNRNAEVPPALVRQLMQEETAKNIRNAQAATVLESCTKQEAGFAREQLSKLADEYEKIGPMTRAKFVKWLQGQQTFVIPEDDRLNGETGKWFTVKKAMSSINRYLDPLFGTGLRNKRR